MVDALSVCFFLSSCSLSSLSKPGTSFFHDFFFRQIALAGRSLVAVAETAANMGYFQEAIGALVMLLADHVVAPCDQP
jgi:hypothetical protein